MPRQQADAVGMDRRAAQVAELYRAGRPMRGIAAALGIGATTVHRDLQRLRSQWRRSAGRDFDALVQDELVKLDHVEAGAWSGWDRSRDDGGAGDPRFLTAALACVDRRCRLLGLDAPRRTQVAAAVSHAVDDPRDLWERTTAYGDLYAKIDAETADQRR